MTDSDCENICTTSGAQPEYDSELKLCKCLLPKTVDGEYYYLLFYFYLNFFVDTDIALIHKNANLIGKKLKSVDLTSDDSIIIKRDVVTTTETTETTGTTEIVGASIPTTPETPEITVQEEKITTTTPKDDLEFNFSFEETVGQQQPPRRPIHRLVTPRRPREPRPITQDQQRIILQQIRDHLNRLTQVSDLRVREMEIEAIRNNLRQLSNTVLIQTPQQRSRVRNVVEEARQRRRMQHRLGASENSTPKHENEVEIALKDLLHGKKRHEIITQDPRLVDE